MTQEVLEALAVSESVAETEDTRATARRKESAPETAQETEDGAPVLSAPTMPEQAWCGDVGAAICRPRATDEADRSAALRASVAAHLDSLCAQAEELRREFPDFDLDAALRDPDFVRLTAPGVGVEVRRAYYALHRGELDARAAEETRQRLARSLSSLPQRPREGGGLHAAATLASDYRSLPREQQQTLKKRILEAAARGEKIYP